MADMFEFKILIMGLFILLTSGCQSINKKDYSIGDGSFKVDVTSYKLNSESEKSLLILPPTGGTNLIDRSYAKTFCAKGYNVYILNSWTHDSETRIDLDIHQGLYTRAQKAISLVLDEIKSPFIGMIGTSVGALHASVSASTQDRLNAVFIITGGGPITDIIVTSDQVAMIKAKEQRFIKYGFKNEAEYLKELKKNFHMEPMELGDGYKKKQLGMIIATQDTTVATVYQRQLQSYWNPRVTLTFDNGHFWTIVNTWIFETASLVDFFETSYIKTKP